MGARKKEEEAGEARPEEGERDGEIKCPSKSQTVDSVRISSKSGRSLSSPAERRRRKLKRCVEALLEPMRNLRKRREEEGRDERKTFGQAIGERRHIIPISSLKLWV